MTAPVLMPNPHPFVVHFAVALLVSSTAFFFVAKAFAARPWAGTLLTAARWNLYLGSAFAIVSIVTGWLALLDARPGASALATVVLHRSTGAIAWGLSLFAAVGVWRTRHRAPGWIVLTTLVIASGAITVSAFYGTQLTYRYGLGIERPKELPRMPVARAMNELHRLRSNAPTAARSDDA